MSTVNTAELYKQALEQNGGGAIPAGRYRLECTGCKVIDEEGKTPTILPNMKRLSNGARTLIGGFHFSEAAAHIGYQNLEGFGLTSEYFVQGPTLEQMGDAITGRIVDVTLEEETWQDKLQNKPKIGSFKLVGQRDAGGNITMLPGAPPPPQEPVVTPVTPTAAAVQPPPVQPPAPQVTGIVPSADPTQIQVGDVPHPNPSVGDVPPPAPAVQPPAPPAVAPPAPQVVAPQPVAAPAAPVPVPQPQPQVEAAPAAGPPAPAPNGKPTPF